MIAFNNSLIKGIFRKRNSTYFDSFPAIGQSLRSGGNFSGSQRYERFKLKLDRLITEEGSLITV